MNKKKHTEKKTCRETEETKQVSRGRGKYRPVIVWTEVAKEHKEQHKVFRCSSRSHEASLLLLQSHEISPPLTIPWEFFQSTPPTLTSPCSLQQKHSLTKGRDRRLTFGYHQWHYLKCSNSWYVFQLFQNTPLFLNDILRYWWLKLSKMSVAYRLEGLKSVKIVNDIIWLYMWILRLQVIFLLFFDVFVFFKLLSKKHVNTRIFKAVMFCFEKRLEAKMTKCWKDVPSCKNKLILLDYFNFSNKKKK